VVLHLANFPEAAAAFKLTEEPVERVDMQLKQSVLINQDVLPTPILSFTK
jgi:hypothetical protein